MSTRTRLWSLNLVWVVIYSLEILLGWGWGHQAPVNSSHLDGWSWVPYYLVKLQILVLYIIARRSCSINRTRPLKTARTSKLVGILFCSNIEVEALHGEVHKTWTAKVNNIIQGRSGSLQYPYYITNPFHLNRWTYNRSSPLCNIFKKAIQFHRKRRFWPFSKPNLCPNPETTVPKSIKILNNCGNGPSKLPHIWHSLLHHP